MQISVYTVYDSKAKMYDRPFVAINDETALRSFTDIANEKTHAIGQHPEDYSMYKVGEWNDSTGELIPQKHISLGKAIELVKENEA